MSIVIVQAVSATGRLRRADWFGETRAQVQSNEVPGKGKLTFVYATDPEGNIIELQARL